MMDERCARTMHWVDAYTRSESSRWSNARTIAALSAAGAYAQAVLLLSITADEAWERRFETTESKIRQGTGSTQRRIGCATWKRVKKLGANKVTQYVHAATIPSTVPSWPLKRMQLSSSQNIRRTIAGYVKSASRRQRIHSDGDRSRLWG